MSQMYYIVKDAGSLITMSSEEDSFHIRPHNPDGKAQHS